MVENLLEVITFWKACSKQNTWESWTHTGCNHQRLVTDRARPRRWYEDSKTYCVRDLDAGSWHKICCGNFFPTASAPWAEGTLCCSWENTVRSQGTYFEGDWGVIVLCTMLLVSCIFFNKMSLFFILNGWILSGQVPVHWDELILACPRKHVWRYSL